MPLHTLNDIDCLTMTAHTKGLPLSAASSTAAAGHKPTRCAVIQDEDWINSVPLASGANGSVFFITNCFFPSAVVKKGWEAVLWAEADKLHCLNHPNIVHLYTMVATGEIGPDGIPQAWLVLQAYGPTLDTLRTSRSLWGTQRSEMLIRMASQTTLQVECASSFYHEVLVWKL